MGVNETRKTALIFIVNEWSTPQTSATQSIKYDFFL